MFPVRANIITCNLLINKIIFIILTHNFAFVSCGLCPQGTKTIGRELVRDLNDIPTYCAG